MSETCTWSATVAPIVRTCETAAMIGESASWNAAGAKALGGLLSKMAAKLDGVSQDNAEIASLRAQLAKLEAEKEAGQFWRGVFDSITDKTDRERIEAELSDYHFVMRQVPDVYMHITGGKMSKCNYYANAVIAEADEYSEKFTNEAADDARRKAIEECAAIADRWTSPEQRLHGHGGAGAEILALLSGSES